MGASSFFFSSVALHQYFCCTPLKTCQKLSYAFLAAKSNLGAKTKTLVFPPLVTVISVLHQEAPAVSCDLDPRELFRKKGNKRAVQ